jgi:hypothetical protein
VRAPSIAPDAGGRVGTSCGDARRDRAAVRGLPDSDWNVTAPADLVERGTAAPRLPTVGARSGAASSRADTGLTGGAERRTKRLPGDAEMDRSATACRLTGKPAENTW